MLRSRRGDVPNPGAKGAGVRATSGECVLAMSPRRRGPTTIDVRGELDRYSVSTLLHILEGPARSAAAVWLDLSGVTFMDLAAHQALVHVCAGHGRPVRVVARSVAVDRIASLAGEPSADRRTAWQRIARLCVSRLEQSCDVRRSRVRNPPDPSQGS
jgi:anti-anti-sigma factor